MPAPLVIPMAENMSSFTSFAEKANHVSENKWKLEVSKLELKQNETLAKMTKEMNELKYELSICVKQNEKRDALKEKDRNSPVAKSVRRNSISSSEDSDSSCVSDSKKSVKPGKTRAERSEHERINNLQRRYSCQLGNGESKVTKVSKRIR